MSQEKESSYIPIDFTSVVNSHGEIVQSGETCRVSDLSEVFAWMRGTINSWYGWSNDGKGTMFDYLSVMKAKHDKWKFCFYKPEDMDSIFQDGKVQIKANRIYQNLAWSLTGKTWSKAFADKYRLGSSQQMDIHEKAEALQFISDHFYVVYPRDRKYKNILDDMLFMQEKFGIDVFLIDPWNAVKLPDGRTDEVLSDVFFEMKEMSLRTNTSMNIINHPRSLNDVKEKDGKYKVVNQFMVLGGSAWDMKMDSQYSIYRPERHLDPKDPKVHFYNLKQKQSEVVGVNRGSYEKIVFDVIKKQYYFDGVNPMTGHVKESKLKQGLVNFSEPQKISDSDEVPF